MVQSQRIRLHHILSELLGDSKKVYFQPPESVRLSYPVIVYHRDDIRVRHADDLVYKLDERFQITYIDRNPESDIPLKLARMPRTKFNRAFISDGLYHNVFTTYI